MSLVSYAYLLFFALAALWTLRADARAGAPAWKAVSSAVLDAVGLAGMWIYLGGAPAPWVHAVWIYVLGLLIPGAALKVVWWLRRGFDRVWEQGERRDPQMRSVLWTFALFLAAVLLPMLWMNARLAFEVG